MNCAVSAGIGQAAGMGEGGFGDYSAGAAASGRL